MFDLYERLLPHVAFFLAPIVIPLFMVTIQSTKRDEVKHLIPDNNFRCWSDRRAEGEKKGCGDG